MQGVRVRKYGKKRGIKRDHWPSSGFRKQYHFKILACLQQKSLPWEWRDCSTAYTSSVIMFSCEGRRSSRTKLLWSPMILFLFSQNTQRCINQACYRFTCTPFSQLTVSVSICEGADLCMGKCVTWGALVAHAACEQNSHRPPSVSPRSPSTPSGLCFSFVFLTFHCLSEAVTSGHPVSALH